MKEYTKQVFSLYGRRFYHREKQAFLESTAKAFAELGYPAALQRASWLGIESWNLILGDLASARNIVIAPYDTPAARLFSHVKCLSSRALSGIFALLPLLLYVAACWLIMACLRLPLFVGEIVLALLLILGYRAVPNTSNFNCTSSGVLLLYRLASQRPPGTAFVFVDHRDFLSLGRRGFLSSFPVQGRRLFYVDCVGVGDTLAVRLPPDMEPKSFAGDSVQILPGKGPLICISACTKTRAGLTISNIMNCHDDHIDRQTLDAALAYLERLLSLP